MRVQAVLALLACTGLAGCSDPDASAADGPDEMAAEPAAPAPSSQSFEFGLGAAFGTPVVGTSLPIDDNRMVSFEVPEGYTGLTATAEWTCEGTDAACLLDVELRRGEQNVVTGGYGASPLTLTLDSPEEGRYTFWAFPSREGAAVVGMQGTLTVDLA